MREPTTFSLWLSDHVRVAPVLRVASWHRARGWSLARAEGVEERAAATAVTSVLDLGLRECASAFEGDGRWWPATARLVRSGKNPGEREVRYGPSPTGPLPLREHPVELRVEEGRAKKPARRADDEDGLISLATGVTAEWALDVTGGRAPCLSELRGAAPSSFFLVRAVFLASSAFGDDEALGVPQAAACAGGWYAESGDNRSGSFEAAVWSALVRWGRRARQAGATTG